MPKGVDCFGRIESITKEKIVILQLIWIIVIKSEETKVRVVALV